jgi:hypothetical protein
VKTFVLILLSFILGAGSLPAQSVTRKYFPEGGVFGSYWASLIYPGFDLGLEKPIKFDEFTWFENGQTVPRYKETYAVYSISMYHHNTLHTNVLLTAGRKNRTQRNSGCFTERTLRGGISRSFLDGSAYVVDQSGSVSRRSLPGNFYLAALFDYGFGYNLKYKTNIPLKPYISFNAMFIAPYNRFFYHRFGVNIGMVYSPTGFMPMKTNKAKF